MPVSSKLRRPSSTPDQDPELTPLVSEDVRKFLKGDTPAEAYIESVRLHAARQAQRDVLLRSAHYATKSGNRLLPRLAVLMIVINSAIGIVLATDRTMFSLSLAVAAAIGVITGLIFTTLVSRNR